MLATLLSIWPAIAAGTIAIPVIIHLINRRRFKIVPWAAMKFLLAAQKQTRKRMRIEQIVLLLIRMAILALVILAMVAVMSWAETIWANPPVKNVLGFLKLSRTGLQNVRKHRVHHIFVLDASLSMNQKVEGQTGFEIARQMALAKIDDNPAGDAYSVLVLKESPTWLVGGAAQDARKVRQAIQDVKPSHGNSSLPAALNMISSKLAEIRPRMPNQAVYFFTDMQETTWLSAAPAELKTEADSKEKNAYLEINEKATTAFVDCGPKASSDNLAVTNVEFDLTLKPYVTVGEEFTLKATVKNFSPDKLASKVRAELLMGKAKENAADPSLQMRFNDHMTASIEANSQMDFEFRNVKFPAPGTYAVQVKIPDDALPQDNSRTIIITVREKIPVLIVNGKASADRFERATEYLRLTLNPFAAGTEPKWLPLRPRVVTPGQFDGMSDADLSEYDCIYWCDVGAFGQNDVRKLDTHLRRGGGFIVSLGENATKHLDRYNDLLYKDGHGLLPAQLLKQVVAPADHHFYLSNSAEGAFLMPPLDVFRADQDQITLRAARFKSYVVSQAGKARTILSFMPEMSSTEKVKRDATLPVDKPAILEWSPPLSKAQQPAPPALKLGQRSERVVARYRGKVILLTSTLNMDWNSWPGSPSYGAMMHELTRLALSGRLREQAQTVGGLLEAYLPGGAEIDVVVKYPAEIEGLKPGKRKTQLIEDVNLFRWADTDYAGIYRVETPSNMEIPFAVNVPTAGADGKGSESHLKRLDEAGLKSTYKNWTFQFVRDVLHVSLDTAAPVPARELEVPLPFGPDLANACLLLVLGLLFLEIFLAWYFGHYTTTEGALSNAPAGPGSTVAAAVIAVLFTILFAIGLFIVTTYWWTGDFLGFLPDLLRNWFERSIGAEALQGGEGSNWNYVPQPWLPYFFGNQTWYAGFLTAAALVMIFFTYKAEAPRVSLIYKLLLGAIRLYLIVLTLWFLLPRPEIHYDREAYPYLVIVIDDTRSMGESDAPRDNAAREKIRELTDGIRKKLTEELPAKINALQAAIAAKAEAAQNDPDAKTDLDNLRRRKAYWEKQRDELQEDKWRPSRLQLAQAVLSRPEPHWLKLLLRDYRAKVQVFHLDAHGRATKLRDPQGDAGDLIDLKNPAALERTLAAITDLEPSGNDSRLGVAVKQVIDHYTGSNLAGVIMLTDGVTTRDETLSDAAAYAGQKGVQLLFVGIGDELKLQELLLHDLQCDDTVYLGDRIVFEVRLTGKGYKDLTVPVLLKVKDKNGKEKELAREMVKVDPSGKSVRIRFRDEPKELGRRQYIIEVEPPKTEANEKPIPPANLRLERTVEVIDTKLIRVLYVEGQPRYEFRFLKFLLEREAPDEKQKANKNKSIELKVLLLDADDDWHLSDKHALANFPPTLQDLNEYDVLIFGDCDPKDKKIRDRLNDVVSYVNGVKEDGSKAIKPGGGILFIAGALNNPHRYKGTPLEKVLPVEPIRGEPPADKLFKDNLSPTLTSVGESNPIFRFSPGEQESIAIFKRLEPMHWYSTGYRIKPAAEVLAVHQGIDAVDRLGHQHPKHPLVVHQHTGSGRSMFFGFDETWRWRLREDEAKYNHFWIQTMRYLSRGLPTYTKLALDQQKPYKVGEEIKVTVTFPITGQTGGNQQGPKITDKTEVKVTVTYQPPGAKDGDPQVSTMKLAKVTGSRGQYEGKWQRSREGKYKFRLTDPDVSASQPDGQKPSAEATVELPPGELDNLRLDVAEMTSAADRSRGIYFPVSAADEILHNLPPRPVVIVPGTVTPTLLWNQWWAFAIVVFLITSEWILRKMKHLL